MSVARKVIGLGRSVRSKESIKVRQPLSSVKIFFDNNKNIEQAIKYFRDIILEELNVKDFEVIKDLDELISYDIKPNLKLLGPKYGSLLPLIKSSIDSYNPSKIAMKVKNGKDISLIINKKQIDILPEEILISVNSRKGFGIESDGEITLGLPLDYSQDLAEEGFSRELVHKIQNLRKEAGFQIENTVNIAFECSKKAEKILKRFRDHIMKETLAVKLDNDFKDDMYIKDFKIDSEELKIGINVAGSIS
jgi:isoleucyl-tRNA synthetase